MEIERAFVMFYFFGPLISLQLFLIMFQTKATPSQPMSQTVEDLEASNLVVTGGDYNKKEKQDSPPSSPHSHHRKSKKKIQVEENKFENVGLCYFK